MAGVWNADGSYEFAPGERARLKGKEKAQKGKEKGKGKGEKGFDKGKGKGKEKGKDKGKEVMLMTAAERLAFAQGALSTDGPAAKKPRLGEPGEEEEEEELPEFDFEKDWKDKPVALLNLKGAKELNGLMATVKEYNEDTKRFLVTVEGGKGDKSIKMENLFKVMTGCIVKLRGLDSIELNDCIGECGRLDVENLRYDITLSDGRHVKAKPANVELVAKYESSKVSGDAVQMERIRSANGLRDRLVAVEEFDFPPPIVLPASALEDYGKKFPKSVVIGRANAANPKGAQMLAREVVSATKISPGSRLVFISMPRDRCVAPALARDEVRRDQETPRSFFTSVDEDKVEDGRAGFGPPMTGLVPLFTMLGFLTLAAWNFYLTAVGFFALWFPGYQWAFVASMTYQAMNVLGTSTMVKVGQKVPFRAAYLTSLTIQMVMILMMPMLAFWSPKEVHGEEVIPSTWGFAAALCCCAVLGLAESCFTSLICGLAGSMGDPKLMGAIMTGQGIVGVVCPVLMLSLKFLSGDPMQWKYQVVFGFFGFCAAMQVLGLFVVRYVPTSHQDHRLAEATMVDVVRLWERILESWTRSDSAGPMAGPRAVQGWEPKGCLVTFVANLASKRCSEPLVDLQSELVEPETPCVRDDWG
ncbi:unnamed protein product [Durusdinium trenchii]|uniref:Uncharacterized protein n=1 Tax=Durusdinium trenchii TaxID=1381693 RepID=A0ABP0PQ73_9DINO